MADPEMLTQRARDRMAEFSAALDKTAAAMLADARAKEHHKHYDSGSWRQAVFAWRGRATLGMVFYLTCLWAVVVVVVLELFQNLLYDDLLTFIYQLPPTPHSLAGGALMFLVVFRTQASYGKWNESRGHWAGFQTGSRDAAIQACTFFTDPALSAYFCKYLVVFVIATRCWLRSEPVDDHMVEHLFTKKEMQMFKRMANDHTKLVSTDSTTSNGRDPCHSWQFEQACIPLYCIEHMRRALSTCVRLKKMGPFHMSLETDIKSLATTFGMCEKVLRTKIPFAYISHLRSGVLIYLLSLPFFVIKDLAWVTIVAVAFLAFMLIGLESTGQEIENPFGYDANDLPMDLYCAEICSDVRDIWKRAMVLYIEDATCPFESEFMEKE